MFALRYTVTPPAGIGAIAATGLTGCASPNIDDYAQDLASNHGLPLADARHQAEAGPVSLQVRIDLIQVKTDLILLPAFLPKVRVHEKSLKFDQIALKLILDLDQ